MTANPTLVRDLFRARRTASLATCASIALACHGAPDDAARAPSADARATHEPGACALPQPDAASCGASPADAAQPAPASMAAAQSVLGAELGVCSLSPRTGFFRDGRCTTGPSDRGRHVVCARVTGEFLDYTRSRGNDLSTPAPEHAFPGLVPGDRWCLCASRWREALEAGVAPPVALEATADAALRFVTREDLDAHALR